MLKYCSYCATIVESEGHTHPEKKCNVCQEVKKLDAFPTNSASLDGHRHTCKACLDAQKRRAKQQKIENRKQQIREKESLSAYGYWWRQEMVQRWDDEWEEEEEYILPIRLDETEIPGFLPTIAYLNWHQETIEDITDILVQKLKEDLR